MTYHHQVAREKGGPEVLDWSEFKPDPPLAGHAAIRVEAAGVLLADVLWQLGIAPVGPKPPFTPGYDLVGVVEETGPGVDGIERGQRVAAMIQYGGYTEHAVVPVTKIVPVPDGVDPTLAAAATTSYLTAHMLVHNVGRLEEGDVLLVHGAGGGTGSAILDVARLAGVKVYGTASRSKHGLVEVKGATPIDYRSEDFVEVLRTKEPNGVDLIVDPIGGDVTKRSLRLLKPKGKLVTTAMLSSIKDRKGGMKVLLAMMRLPLWSLGHPGRRAFFWDVVAAAKKDKARYRSDLATVFDLLKEEKLSPEIGRVMPMRDAPEAQRLLLDYAVRGKIVLVPGQM
jgi:NADPH:quinone reductase-like Zn-dependent oxidoreductase